jgi:hypothetical protein
MRKFFVNSKKRIWVCGTRDSPTSCDSYDEKWNHFPEEDTIYPHSYGSMTTSYRGLGIIGGKKLFGHI